MVLFCNIILDRIVTYEVRLLNNQTDDTPSKLGAYRDKFEYVSDDSSPTLRSLDNPAGCSIWL